MKNIVIVSATRTAIGAFNGALSSVNAITLGQTVLDSAIERAGLDATTIDEVIMGNVLQAGLGQNPSRQMALKAGIPMETPAFTVNKVCGSGLKAVALAAQAIKAGDSNIIVAGGAENMSQAPYLLPKARWGYRLGNQEVVDTLIHDGLTCATNYYHMGITAENIAEKYGITRQEQDAYSLRSQQLASKAVENNLFDSEITPVILKSRKGDIVFSKDEYPKADATSDALAQLRPAFKPDGTITAGNASGINDGAAALVLMSEDKAKSLGLTPLARIISYASAGVDPALMGMGPVPATQQALLKANLTLNNIDLIEANEAFAAQFLAVGRELNFDMDKTNINGGAIALGHPIGASGARILVTLLHNLKTHNKTLGLATLCIGGGQGIAMIIERMN